MAANDASSTLTPGNKRIAGLLLIFFTVSAIYVLIAFWPDRIPETDKDCALYEYEWFHMRLDTGACRQRPDTIVIKAKVAVDTSKNTVPKKDSVISKADSIKADSVRKQKARLDSQQSTVTVNQLVTQPTPKKYIHLNIILMIMVAVAGFLGNMIHIATSFTAFVGSETFKKSWVLWYTVKPFTASALAIALYVCFGATSNPSHVDLDRTLTIAILAGLFTDVATQKLKEMFDVILKPKDNRPDKLEGKEFSIDDKKTEPATLTKAVDNKIVLHGKNLTSKELVIKMGDAVPANISVEADTIRFTYKIPDAEKDKEKIVLLITDKATGKVTLFKKEFTVKGNATDEGPETDRGEDTDEDETPVG